MLKQLWNDKKAKKNAICTSAETNRNRNFLVYNSFRYTATHTVTRRYNNLNVYLASYLQRSGEVNRVLCTTKE